MYSNHIFTDVVPPDPQVLPKIPRDEMVVGHPLVIDPVPDPHFHQIALAPAPAPLLDLLPGTIFLSNICIACKKLWVPKPYARAAFTGLCDTHRSKSPFLSKPSSRDLLFCWAASVMD